MIRLFILVFLLSSLHISISAQLRHASLIIESKQIYDFGESDILVADELIMKDSSSIKLNYVKDDNYIHCKKLIVGKGCKIIGSGENGRKAKDGGNGYSLDGPCHDGTNGRNGARGGDGINGNNLFLYADEIIFPVDPEVLPTLTRLSPYCAAINPNSVLSLLSMKLYWP